MRTGGRTWQRLGPTLDRRRLPTTGSATGVQGCRFSFKRLRPSGSSGPTTDGGVKRAGIAALRRPRRPLRRQLEPSARHSWDGQGPKIKPEFDRRGVKINGPVGRLDRRSRPVGLGRPRGTRSAADYPIIAIRLHPVAKLCGMLPASTSGDAKSRTPVDNQTAALSSSSARTRRVKLTIVHPMTTGGTSMRLAGHRFASAHASH